MAELLIENSTMANGKLIAETFNQFFIKVSTDLAVQTNFSSTDQNNEQFPDCDDTVANDHSQTNTIQVFKYLYS